MALIISDDDEDIFLGEKMTLKEVRTRLGVKAKDLPKHSSVGFRNSPPCNSQDDVIENITIIETHSTPNILSSCNNLTEIGQPVSTPSLDKTNRDWDLSPNDSFLRVEKLVSEMYISSNTDKERVAVSDKESSLPGPSKGLIEDPLISIDITDEQIVQTPKSTLIEVPKKFITKPLNKSDLESASNSNYTTPAKNGDIQEYSTPLSELKSDTPIFKTPSNTLQASRSFTKRCFNNIVSPVAAYIKGTPSAPVLDSVDPKIPLHGVSSIPRPVRSIPKPTVMNKENIKLRSIAYRHAKETKLITPDKTKIPHSQFAKPASVIRHNRIEGNSNKTPLTIATQHNNSSADLSLHQANVSIGIQRSATKLPKPKIVI